MTFVLAVMLAMMLVITGGGWAALHDGGHWQVYAPSLQSYLQVSDTWPIPDPTASVPLPRYAFAQVSGNTPPVVQAGGDLTVGEGDTVMLSGSVTDTDGDPMTYTWSQTGPVTPRITFANASASSTTFTAPSVTGDTTFTFVITAHDGTQPATDTLNVTVKETGAAFITTWAVSDSDRDITLPMMGTYSILWGDGSHSPDVNDSQFHSYDAAGIYTVTVLGEGLENIYLHGDTANARQFRSIEQWGDTKWTTMNGAFGRAANMVYHATVAPNLSGVTDMTYMFFNTASFDGNLSDWNVSSVTHMTYMFLGASSFDGDISGWDVSSVTNMYHTFEGASVFNGDISGWDVSSVTNMNSMFFLASAFDGDISGWDVSSVTNMGNMFLGASSFDGDISGWDVSSVTAMPSMFISTPIFNQNLGTWYIVPARTDFDVSGSSLDVTTISAQNPYLSGQNPIYRIGTGGNSDLFEMRGSTLAFRGTPDVGSYTVKVTASGNSIFENGNNWRMLEITVRSSANGPPTVDAGQDRTVNEGDAVTLNGTVSDHEGDHLTYLWSHDSVLPITVSNATSQLTTFTAPAVDSDTTVIFVLSVSDDINTAVTDQVTITIQDVPANNAYPRSIVEINDGTANGPVLSNRDNFGMSVAAIGDLDGDGVPDLAAGASGDDNGGPDRGAVHVMFMNRDGTIRDTVEINSGTANGPVLSTGDSFGVSVVAIGDLDGDGVPDLVVGAYGEDNPGENSGAVHVMFMNRDGTVKDTVVINEGTANGPVLSDSDDFGISVAAIDDLDGDGVPDLVVGANGDRGAGPNSGAVHVMFMNRDGTVKDTVKINSGTANGLVLSAADGFGISVAAIDDLDGDGVPDIAAGAWYDRNSGPDRGAVHVMFMNRDGTVKDTVEINSGTANGPVLSDSDHFGVSVAAIGDFDGDGVPDLAAGASGDDNGGPDRGAVHVMFMNRDGTVKDTVEINSGTANGPVLSDSDDFGVSVAAIGDFDGDGVPDLAAGALNDDNGGPDRGAVHIIYINDMITNGNGTMPLDAVDTSSPAPVISSSAQGHTNAYSIDFTVDFGEPVDPATFTSSDVHASGGTVSDPLPVNGTTMFVFTVSDLSAGNLTVHVPEGGILDPAGNGNTASDPYVIKVDWTHPSPSIYTAATSPVNASSIDFTVDFGEPVDPATFTSSDVHGGSCDVHILRRARIRRDRLGSVAGERHDHVRFYSLRPGSRQPDSPRARRGHTGSCRQRQHRL